jgi:hypothetical protein
MTRIGFLLLSSLAFACTDQGRAPEVRKSARARLTDTPIIAAEPALAFMIPDSVGGASAEMGAALPLATKGFAIADWDGHRILVFSSAAELVRIIGRTGSGPGEFQGPSLIQVLASDTLLVWDPYLRRISWLDAKTGRGRYLQTRTSDLYGGNPIVGLLDGGRLLVRHDAPVPVTDSTPAGLLTRIRLLDDGGRLVAELPAEFPVRYQDGRGFRFFAPSLRTATDGRRIFIGYSSGWNISVLDADFRRVGQLTRSWQTRPVTDQDKRAIRSSMTRPDLAPGFLDDSRFNTTVPAFGKILPSPDGTVWVLSDAAPYQYPDSVSVFSSENRFLGSFSLPSRFRPTAVGPDYLVGTGTRADGDFEIRLYRVSWHSQSTAR